MESKRKKEYQRYLASAEWAKIRIDIIHSRGGKCERCGGRGQQVHHLTYANLFCEEPEDLVLLCGRCHQDEHGLLDKKGKKKKKQPQANTKPYPLWQRMVYKWGIAPEGTTDFRTIVLDLGIVDKKPQKKKHAMKALEKSVIEHLEQTENPWKSRGF